MDIIISDIAGLITIFTAAFQLYKKASHPRIK